MSDYLALPCFVGGYGFPSWAIFCLLEGSPAKLWHVLVLAVFDCGPHCTVAPVSTALKLCFFFLIVFFPFLCSASLGFVHCNFAENKTGSLAVLATFLALPRLPKILPMWEGFCGCVVWSCMPMLRQHWNHQTYLEPFWIRRFVWFSILDKKANRLTGSGNMVACK